MLFVRPRLSFTASPAVAGAFCRVTVIVDCSHAVTVDAIDVVVRGLQCARDPMLTTQTFPGFAFGDREFWRVAARIPVDVRLQPGRHERAVTLQLPEGAPSSYRGVTFEIAYEIAARLRVVGWFDVRARAVLPVRGSPAQALDDRVAFATRKQGPEGRRPYFEVAISPRLIEPGASIDAVLSLANVDDRCRVLHARLLAVEGTTHPFAGYVERNHELARWTLTPVGDAFAQDTPVQLGLRMPSSVVPGFAVARRVSLRWLLEFRAEIDRGFDPRAWIPVDFGRVDALDDRRRATPTAVGSERIQLLWRRFADKSGMSFDGQRLSGTVAGWRLDVWRSDAPSKGVGLELELRHPSLGIGLGFHRGWSARDREHARALAAVPVPAIGEPYEVDDDGIRWFVAKPGLNHERLAWAVREVCLTAERLREVIDGLDVPTDLRDWAAPLQRLAVRYDGELSRASCTVLGKREALSLRIAPIWEDDEVAFCVELELATPMSRETQARWNAADGSLLGELATRIDSITAEGGKIRCGMARAWTPAQAVDDIDQLVLLAAASGPGPYR